ncbi:hypothetical protein D3C77_664010 [compost metagenome]
MVRKVVTPARISVRTLVPCALSWNSFSSMVDSLVPVVGEVGLLQQSPSVGRSQRRRMLHRPNVRLNFHRAGEAP